MCKIYGSRVLVNYSSRVFCPKQGNQSQKHCVPLHFGFRYKEQFDAKLGRKQVHRK